MSHEQDQIDQAISLIQGAHDAIAWMQGLEYAGEGIPDTREFIDISTAANNLARAMALLGAKQWPFEVEPLPIRQLL
jgi:hypothetical protein